MGSNFKTVASKKRKPSKKNLRGGSGTRAPVRFRVARVISGNESTVKRGKEEFYKEITFCLKSDEAVTTRKRPGRPRKQPLNPIADATDVIYLPDAKSQDLPKHFPLQTRGGRGCSRGRTPSIVDRNILRARKCVVYPSTITKTSQLYTPVPNNKPVRSTCKQVKEDVKDNWPEDLRNLVDSWDSLPESSLRETVKWLTAPPCKNQPLPQVVSNIQGLVSELFSGPEEYGDWLLTEIYPKDKPLKLPETAPPKVVVESQPNSLQNCCQWSSMTANQEFKES